MERRQHNEIKKFADYSIEDFKELINIVNYWFANFLKGVEIKKLQLLQYCNNENQRLAIIKFYVDNDFIPAAEHRGENGIDYYGQLYLYRVLK